MGSCTKPGSRIASARRSTWLAGICSSKRTSWIGPVRPTCCPIISPPHRPVSPRAASQGRLPRHTETVSEVSMGRSRRSGGRSLGDGQPPAISPDVSAWAPTAALPTDACGARRNPPRRSTPFERLASRRNHAAQPGWGWPSLLRRACAPSSRLSPRSARLAEQGPRLTMPVRTTLDVLAPIAMPGTRAVTSAPEVGALRSERLPSRSIGG